MTILLLINKLIFLGLIAADGNIDNKRLRIELTDKEVLELFRDDICPDKPIYSYNRMKKGKQTYSLSLDSKKFLSVMEKWNIFPRKSYKNSSLPNLSNDLMSSFVRGYFDGNGSVYLDSKYKKLRIKFIGNSQFIKELLIFLNLDLKIHTTKNNFTSYFTIAKADDIYRIYNFMYKNSNTTCLLRKYSKFQDYYNNQIKND